MTLLQKLGLTKESMAKMLGPVTPFKDPNPRVNRRWEAVPTEIRESILKADKSFTLRELAKKYDISITSVWNIKNKQPNKQ
jgi:DNA invertase Pin-like site-specific DNA recombinase